MEAKKRIEKNNVSIFNASKKQYSLPTTTKSSHKQKPVSYTNSPYAIQNDILGGYRAEMEAEAAAKKQNARAYSVDVFDPQAVYRLITSTMSTTEIVIAFVIWFAIRLVIIVAFYYLARGVRRLWRAPFEKPAAVVLSVLLAVPSVLSFLFIAMIPAELSQYKDGFWLLFSWIVFFI